MRHYRRDSEAKLNDYSEVTAMLPDRHKLLLHYARQGKYFDAMMVAGNMSLHYNALAHKFQELAKTKNITADEAIAILDADK